MRKQLLTALFAILVITTNAQKGFPVNGVADPREGLYAFTHATIVKDPQTTIAEATLLIKDGKIYLQAGAGVVFDSDPKSEYQECINKAQALIKACERIREFV